jgi:DnaJ-class molecular chaperone
MDFEEDFYEVLNVERNASEQEIKKAFYKLVKLYHPDKQTDFYERKKLHKKFVLLNNAYTTLINPETRKIYDKKLEMTIFCTLEEAYTGVEKLITKTNSSTGGYFQTNQDFAPNCSMSSHNTCVVIPRGVKTGDVIGNFQIHVRRHAIFKRIEDDLYMKLHVPFFLMITGCDSFPIIPIDKQELLLSWSRIIKPYETIKIPDKGMPIKGTNMFGDLYITFVPQFPDFIDNMKATKLRKLFVSENHAIFFQKSTKKPVLQIS